jgi:hypothetical protein
MRRAFELIFGSMLDARARRAFDETFVDWAYEARSATTAPARLRCHARGGLSVLRTLTGVVAQDVASLPKSGVWIRAGALLVITYVSYWQLYARLMPESASAADRLRAAALLFPGWMLMCGPAALFIAALRRPRNGRPGTPFLGVACLSFALALLGASWAVPAANQEFRQVTFEMHGGARELSRGAAELTLPELLWSEGRQESRAAQLQISNRLALVMACPVLVLLASQVYMLRRRYRWVLAPLLLSGFGFAIEGAEKLGTIDKAMSIWFFVAAAFLLAVGIGSGRHWRRQHPVLSRAQRGGA